jgi:hypothetical protein
MRKKQWKDIVALHNYLSNEINEINIETKAINAKLEDLLNIKKEDVSTLSDTLDKQEKLVQELLTILKTIEPAIKKYNRFRRHILTKNAITIKDKKGNLVLQSDEQGNYVYSIEGRIKSDDEIEDLLDEQIDFELLVINNKSEVLKNKEIKKALKEFTD